MKDLRERCTKLYNALPSELGRYRTHASVIDQIEAFAREIRAEALEEAVNEVGYWPTGEATRKAICALAAKESEKSAYDGNCPCCGVPTSELHARVEELREMHSHVCDLLAAEREERNRFRKVVAAVRALPKKSMAIKMALRELDEEHE